MPEPRRLRSTFPVRDMLSEALSGMLQRPGRTVLTLLGTVLGVGAFVAILGFTATTSGQISSRFNALSATEVDINDVGTGLPGDTSMSFDEDSNARVRALPGVVHSGVWWALPLRDPVVTASANRDATDAGDSGGLNLFAADPSALAATHPTLGSGTLYNAFHESRSEKVAVLGKAAARRLGISRLDTQPAVFIDDTAYTVVGVIDDMRREPAMLMGVIIPTSTALDAYGPPTVNRATMIVETRLGAAQQVARQAPVVIRPNNPDLLQAVAPVDPKTLENGVTGDLNSLFLLLAAISLVIGAIGIANTTLVAVLERTAEIGLRRSLGARPRHIASQFLTESTVLGTLGGLIGTAIGVALVVCVAIARDWTAILQPWGVLPAPLIGSLVGLVAGLYPALRAATIEPVEALRR
ncbi:ABC transporter permease [Streptomyces capillispiralis]|uniref:ABC transporter permease n=1 Tax=Streptomyces capillispiralis TaxID=68182 RepID=UPI0036821422